MIGMGICMIDQAFNFSKANTALHSRETQTVYSQPWGIMIQ